MLSQLTHVATLAALEAGELLAKGFGSTLHISNKEGKQNLVTEYDLSSQKLIIDKIKQFFPDHQFYAEESAGDVPSFDQITWVIDPLDGTVNFAHQIPFFCASVAAVRGTEVLAGATYNPLLKELFIAEKGGGAYLNGKRLSVTKRKNLSESLVATGFPYDVDENPLHCLDRFTKVARMGVPIRRFGSACLDMAYVAAGRFDIFWEVKLNAWDVAVGKLLIEEAGGKVSHYDGTPHPLYGYIPLLATNGHLHETMVKMLREDL